MNPHSTLRLTDHKNTKSTVIPFKLIRYKPKVESQILITNRKELTKYIPHTPNNQTKHHHTASLQFSSTIDSPVKKSFSTDISSIDLNSFIKETPKKSLSPNMSANISRIETLRWKPQKSLPKISLSQIMKDKRSNNKEPTQIKEIPTSHSSSFSKTFSSFLNQPEQINYQCIPSQDVFHPVILPGINIGLWILKETHGSKPCSREGSQIICANNKVYLYGGQSRTLCPDVRELDLITWNWKIINTQYAPQGKIGHSVILYKNKLIVYGGYSSHAKNGSRRCSRRLHILSINDWKWQNYLGSGAIPPPRRNHAAAKLGKYMFVYGGIGQDGIPSGGLYILDMKTQEWKLPEVVIFDDPGCRSHATLTAVFDEEILNDHKQSLFFSHKQSNSMGIANSGFYLYGGLDLNGQPCNSLFGLYLRNGQFIWMEIRGGNKTPPARYSHTATAIKHKIFIFGGRNDNLFQTTGNSCLDDVHIFNVDTLQWDYIDIYGNYPEGRWGHCSTSFESKLMILGGMNHKNYMSSDFYYLETDKNLIDESMLYSDQSDNKFEP